MLDPKASGATFVKENVEKKKGICYSSRGAGPLGLGYTIGPKGVWELALVV